MRLYTQNSLLCSVSNTLATYIEDSSGPKRTCVLVVRACYMLSCSVMSDSLRPPWIVASQAPLSMGFSRQEYCSGMPCPPPGTLPDSGIEPMSFRSPALTGRLFTASATWEASGTAVHPSSHFFHICDLRGMECGGGCQGLIDRIQSFLGHKEREEGKEA